MNPLKVDEHMKAACRKMKNSTSKSRLHRFVILQVLALYVKRPTSELAQKVPSSFNTLDCVLRGIGIHCTAHTITWE
jgi:hypothetical protein